VSWICAERHKKKLREKIFVNLRIICMSVIPAIEISEESLRLQFGGSQSKLIRL
jgi:hypothetical protein